MKNSNKKQKSQKENKSRKSESTNKSIKSPKVNKQRPKKLLNRSKYNYNIYDAFILKYNKLNPKEKEQINGTSSITFQDVHLHTHCNEILQIAKELKYSSEYEAIDKKDFYNNLIQLYINHELRKSTKRT